MAPKINVLRSRMMQEGWVHIERMYGDAKYPDKTANDQRSDDMWLQFVSNYLGRAMTLGLDSKEGRRALGKALVTCMDWLESAIRRHGPMPKGGVPSGTS